MNNLRFQNLRGFFLLFRGFGQKSAFWPNCRENGQIVDFLTKMSGKWPKSNVHFPDILVKKPTIWPFSRQFGQKADFWPKPRKAQRNTSGVQSTVQLPCYVVFSKQNVHMSISLNQQWRHWLKCRHCCINKNKKVDTPFRSLLKTQQQTAAFSKRKQ